MKKIAKSSASSSSDKQSAAEMLTATTMNAMQEMINNGVAPWNKPWCAAKRKGQMSYGSGKSYSPLNQFLLTYQLLMLGYTVGAEDEYSTFNQLKKEGVNVKGYKTCCIWKPMISTWFDENDLDEDGNPKMHSRTRFGYERVFNRQQLGLEKKYPATNNIVYSHEMDEKIMDVVHAYCDKYGVKLTISEDANGAYQLHEQVVVPHIGRFESANEFYSTLFHELTHSTARIKGNERKCHAEYALNRDARAQEEIVAELGAASLCAYFGMTATADANSAAYLDGWSKGIDGDKANAFIKAISYASKAIEYILGVVDGKEDETVA